MQSFNYLGKGTHRRAFARLFRLSVLAFVSSALYFVQFQFFVLSSTAQGSFHATNDAAWYTECLHDKDCGYRYRRWFFCLLFGKFRSLLSISLKQLLLSSHAIPFAKSWKIFPLSFLLSLETERDLPGRVRVWRRMNGAWKPKLITRFLMMIKDSTWMNWF